MEKKINYYSRSFADIRTDLVNFTKQYYPEILNDFNDASIGMLFIELNAALGDILSFNTDRMFQETQIDYAQERKSLLSIARTYGLKVPGKKPSITLLDFSVTVPVNGDTFDLSYCPLIRQGASVQGGGQVFETLHDIDFSSPFTAGGLPNRIIIPNINSNNIIESYTITKRDFGINGNSKIYKQSIGNQRKPFMEVVLPDKDVLHIESIIILPGPPTSITPNINDFLDFKNRWYEVDSLAENKIFIETSERTSDNTSVKPGKYVEISQKFISEYTDLGFYKIIFGSGDYNDISTLNNFITEDYFINVMNNFINNLSLGEIPPNNSTMYIKYRVGGGKTTNLGPNLINQIGVIDIQVNGLNATINAKVQKSLTVNNPTPALGGRDGLEINELRNLIRYNFSAQNRAVTLKDYKSRIALMPGDFGVPYRYNVFEDQNKINIYMLNLDSNGNLTNLNTTALKENIAEYLSEYRMVNDYVTVNGGKIFNLSFETDLFIEKDGNKIEIVNTVIGVIEDYMDKANLDMGTNIYLSQLIEKINNVGGVLNVIDLRVYNKVGMNQYSLDEISQPYIDDATRQIDTNPDFTINADPTSMFEIKYPGQDIKVRVKS